MLTNKEKITLSIDLTNNRMFLCKFNLNFEIFKIKENSLRIRNRGLASCRKVLSTPTAELHIAKKW